LALRRFPKRCFPKRRFPKCRFSKWRFPKRSFSKWRFPKRHFPLNVHTPNDVSPNDVYPNDVSSKVGPNFVSPVLWAQRGLPKFWGLACKPQLASALAKPPIFRPLWLFAHIDQKLEKYCNENSNACQLKVNDDIRMGFNAIEYFSISRYN
jgi:hypothetical protein